MRYGTVCSGVEAFGPAWEKLGFECAFHAEIAPHPSAVLRYHFPSVINYGDFTMIYSERVDLLAGGTPCQTFSVQGLREGLNTHKGGLALEFIRLAQRVGAKWLLWENVLGVLQADRGQAFGSFLGGLAECGYGFAYRVLDAQYFGVAQRRQRVFVVAYLGDWRPPAAVLFERESFDGLAQEVPAQYVASTLCCGPGAKGGDLAGLEAVGGEIRKLTPKERERLMGWPDDWTRYGISQAGKHYELPNAARYHITGNGWAAPVVEWLGERIMMIDKLTPAPSPTL